MKSMSIMKLTEPIADELKALQTSLRSAGRGALKPIVKLTKEQIADELQALQTVTELAAIDIENVASANDRQASLESPVKSFEKYVTEHITGQLRAFARALQITKEEALQDAFEEMTKEEITGELQAILASTEHMLLIAAEFKEYLDEQVF